MMVTFIICTLLFIYLLMAILVKTHRWLYRKGYPTLALLIPIAVALYAGYEIYISFQPTQRFYKQDFETYTHLKFPSSGKFIRKEASFPDLQGRYYSMALIELSAEDYQALEKQIQSDSLSRVDTSCCPFFAIVQDDLSNTIAAKKENFRVVYKKHVKKIFTIAFCKDGKTILYQKNT